MYFLCRMSLTCMRRCLVNRGKLLYKNNIMCQEILCNPKPSKITWNVVSCETHTHTHTHIKVVQEQLVKTQCSFSCQNKYIFFGILSRHIVFLLKVSWKQHFTVFLGNFCKMVHFHFLVLFVCWSKMTPFLFQWNDYTIF